MVSGFDIPAVKVGESMCLFPSQQKLGYMRCSFWQEDRLDSRESSIFFNFYSKICQIMPVGPLLLINIGFLILWFLDRESAVCGFLCT